MAVGCAGQAAARVWLAEKLPLPLVPWEEARAGTAAAGRRQWRRLGRLCGVRAHIAVVPAAAPPQQDGDQRQGFQQQQQPNQGSRTDTTSADDGGHGDGGEQQQQQRSRALVSALKVCRDLAKVRAIHGGCSAADLDAYVGATLVHAYVKCGSLAEATATLERLPPARRSVVAWTSLIAGHAAAGEPKAALALYGRMQQQQAEDGAAAAARPNGHTFVAALKACTGALAVAPAAWCLAQVRRVHADAGDAASDAFVGAALVDAYAKCGALDAARAAWERTPAAARDVVCWTAMATAYAQAGAGAAALRVVADMRAAGVAPTARTLVAAAAACGAVAAGGDLAGAAAAVRGVHAQAEQAAPAAVREDVYLGSALVDAYGKCGCVEEARAVFDGMRRRNVVSWTAMVMAYAAAAGTARGRGEEAVRLVRDMRRAGVVPNARTLVAALKACAGLAGLAGVADEEEGDGPIGVKATTTKQQQQQQQREWVVEQVKVVHADASSSGLDTDVFVATMLVDAYAKCGCLAAARDVFERMPQRDVVAWTAMMAGYAQAEDGEAALELYGRMRRAGVAATERTFAAALRACAATLLVVVPPVQVQQQGQGGEEGQEQGEEQEDEEREEEDEDDDDEEDEEEEPANQQPNPQEEEAGADGHKAKCLERAKSIHRDAATAGMDAARFVGTMLVDVYAKCGSMADARRAFDALAPADRDVVAWTALISGYAQQGQGEAALALYQAMQRQGVAPDARTFVAALMACGAAAALEQGRRVHAQITAAAASSVNATDPFVTNALIDMYAKCGSMADAHHVFDTAAGGVAIDDVVAWNALLAGYARHGHIHRVWALYDQLLARRSPAPDGVTFLCLLTACAQAGDAPRARALLAAMPAAGGVAPAREHWTCLVDLLGRAGRLRDALAVAERDMVRAGAPPDAAVWHVLLGACVKWRDLRLGRRVFLRAVAADPAHAAPYILMAGLCTAAGAWREAARWRGARVRRAAWKEAPGRSWWTDGAGGVHGFMVAAAVGGGGGGGGGGDQVPSLEEDDGVVVEVVVREGLEALAFALVAQQEEEEAGGGLCLAR